MNEILQKIKNDWPSFVLWWIFPLVLTSLGYVIKVQLYNHLPTQIREVKTELRRDIDRLDKNIDRLEIKIDRMAKENNQRFDKINQRLDKMVAQNNQNFKDMMFLLSNKKSN